MSEAKLFTDKKRRTWLEKGRKFHPVINGRGNFLPEGTTTCLKVKGPHTYFDDPDLLRKVLEALKSFPYLKLREKQKQERKRKLDFWLQHKRWSIARHETDKLLHSLRNGQYIMVRSYGLFRLAKVDRSAKGNLCMRKYANKSKSWADRRVSLDSYVYLRNLNKLEAASYMQSLRWPSEKKLPRTNKALERRINKRVKTTTSYLSIERLRMRYGKLKGGM